MECPHPEHRLCATIRSRAIPQPVGGLPICRDLAGLRTSRPLGLIEATGYWNAREKCQDPATRAWLRRSKCGPAALMALADALFVIRPIAAACPLSDDLGCFSLGHLKLLHLP